MKKSLHKLIKIDGNSDLPKYQQIVHSIFHAIENGILSKGDKIPSLNVIRDEFALSRDTVLVAFNELKAKGIIASTPGKGYYILSTEIKREQKIFLLFDELNAFKEILYSSFINAINDRASVDIYFHYFNKRVFKNLIRENLNNYTTFIIMPVYFTDIKETINEITNGNVFMLDQLNPELADQYPAIYQNFRKDTYHALSSGKQLIGKYNRLIMVYPGGKEPQGQLEGYYDFCKKHNMYGEVVENLNTYTIRKGEVYIVPNDLDLVHLIKSANAQDLRIGEDIGIISYNDTPLKEVVANGITTISTDFNQMGRLLADMVLNNNKQHIENPSSLIIRGSL